MVKLFKYGESYNLINVVIFMEHYTDLTSDCLINLITSTASMTLQRSQILRVEAMARLPQKFEIDKHYNLVRILILTYTINAKMHLLLCLGKRVLRATGDVKYSIFTETIFIA